MTYNFRKIPAENTNLIKTKSENIYLFESFKTFLTSTTNNKDSGKISSYTLYLMRLIHIYNEVSLQKISDTVDMNGIYGLFNICLDPNFKNYNSSESRFPNASLEAFKAFLFSKTNGETVINEEIINQDTSHNNSTPKLGTSKSIITIPRDNSIVVGAKKQANYKCAIDHTHITFRTESSPNYLEAHHLIPLSYQTEFSKDIDILENIICLCPTCHRKIHYSDYETRKRMIIKIYDDYKVGLFQIGLKVSLSKILSYYGIY